MLFFSRSISRDEHWTETRPANSRTLSPIASLRVALPPSSSTRSSCRRYRSLVTRILPFELSCSHTSPSLYSSSSSSSSTRAPYSSVHGARFFARVSCNADPSISSGLIPPLRRSRGSLMALIFLVTKLRDGQLRAFVSFLRFAFVPLCVYIRICSRICARFRPQRANESNYESHTLWSNLSHKCVFYKFFFYTISIRLLSTNDDTERNELVLCCSVGSSRTLSSKIRNSDASQHVCTTPFVISVIYTIEHFKLLRSYRVSETRSCDLAISLSPFAKLQLQYNFLQIFVSNCFVFETIEFEDLLSIEYNVREF